MKRHARMLSSVVNTTYPSTARKEIFVSPALGAPACSSTLASNGPLSVCGFASYSMVGLMVILAMIVVAYAGFWLLR